MVEKRRVLVTGSAGCIGRIVCKALAAAGHFARGLDVSPSAHAAEALTGSIEDAAMVDAAVDGCDTVVHLAAYPDPADFVATLVGPNVIGLHNVVEACRKHAVRRVVLASSIQVVGSHPWRERVVTLADPPVPRNHYALTKLLSEQTGEMYSRVHGLSVLSIRIAWLPRNSKDLHRLEQLGRSAYLSHNDCAAFFLRCVEVEHRGFAILYAQSKAHHAGFDIEPARKLLGYEPQDLWPAGSSFDG